jgi:hypothetical protein
MNILHRAQWIEHIMEQRLQLLDKTLMEERHPHQELYARTNSPLQRLLLQGKLRRAELEVVLYGRAINRANEFWASRPEREKGEILWFLVFVC